MNLHNAHVLVTGANRGLGKALIAELLKTDASVIYAAAREPETIDITDARIKPVKLDVSDQASVNTFASSLDRLDLLINNAGVIEFGDILAATEADIDRCIDVNVKGVWRLSQAFAPLLKRNGGALCNILSLVSLASMPGLAAYNLSKAAAWSMTLSLRATLQSHNISVHGVFPGAIDTDMTAGMDIDKITPAEVAHEIIEGIAKGEEDIYPAPMFKEVYTAWKTDHKAVEKQFAAM